MLDFSIEINNNTYDAIADWKAFPKRFNLGQATPKGIPISVPYRDGSVDPTELMGVEEVFDNRNVIIPVLLASDNPGRDYSAICNLLNGRFGKLITNDDPDFYHYGKFKIGGKNTNKSQWTFNLMMSAYPFKYKKNLTIVSHVSNGEMWQTNIVNDRMRTLPSITISKDGLVSGNINGSEFSFNGSGTYQIPIELKEGNNTCMVLASAGTEITISYQEGRF